jgi:RNA 3'-terminal phosphate cyclase (ATP)
MSMSRDPITIDGSMGEGGGQVLRTSLALSLVTGKPFRIEKIRAGREKPGLLRQHLTAVNAAAAVGGAQVEGAALGSREITFRPGSVRPGEHRFAVGTAGSATLVLQAVLPALLGARGPSTLTLEGGTHNPNAPPFDFLDRAFLPLLRRMGVRVEAALERPGFYPAGGGKFEVRVEPAERLVRLDLPARGDVKRRLARALVSNLPRNIADRELKAVRDLLSWERSSLVAEEVQGSPGPGNLLMLELESEHVTEVFTGFGQKGVTAEKVAGDAIDELREYLASGAPVGKHLADQLLVPIAVAGRGSFSTIKPTRHTTTNIDVISRFLDVKIETRKEPGGTWTIEVSG